MIPKKPGPDVIRGGYRLSEKIMLQQSLERDDESKKSHLALSRLRPGAREEQLHLAHELVPRRLALQRQMIVALQCDEARPRNGRRDDAPMVERRDVVVAAVGDERRH